MNLVIREIEARLPHYAKGPIVKGFGRGSTELGFPTANFSEEVDEGPVFDMVMSVGYNPFYNNEKRAMETHIIHKFEGDLYGKMLSVIMVGYLRAEANYDSMEKLVQAIENDIDNGKKLNLEDKFAKFKTDQFFLSN
eukprot:GFUD01043430.1.p1 GENE.GFUD01043430.1~~GFUD01043430.1.p1  ORF type:complete len:137 (+),score=46.40 GFUD01043430.1:60-470(+)